MFVSCCGITATSAVQAHKHASWVSPPRPPCRPECCCRRNSLLKQSWQRSRWGSHKFKKGERRREQQGGRVGKRRKLSVAMMCQEKLFGLRGRLKSCRVMTFGSISTPLFLFRHQVCICGNGSQFVSQKTFENRCEKSKKENLYGLRSQPLLNKQNYL